MSSQKTEFIKNTEKLSTWEAKEPKPEDLLKEAQETPKKKLYVCLEEYGEIIHVLYTKKDMTYSEVQEWLAQHGLSYTVTTVSNAYKNWKYKKALAGEEID